MSQPPPPPHAHRPHRRRAQQERNPALLPTGDHNAWYYPSHGYSSDEDELPVSVPGGNWGKKHQKGARWVRAGKMTAWGPRMDEWEAENRSRKRLKLLMPREERSPSPPTLPHLDRAVTPPLVMPYPQPSRQHYTYTSFVMDKAVTHTFRSTLLSELEEATNRLIEGEAAMKRALGQLWQVINDSQREPADSMLPKQEEADGNVDERDDREQRHARAPDLTPPSHKIFLTKYEFVRNNETVTHFGMHEPDNLEKSFATLRELQDDGREYVERLEEIRNGLGDVKWQRDRMWEEVRGRAIDELHETAKATVDANEAMDP